MSTLRHRGVECGAKSNAFRIVVIAILGLGGLLGCQTTADLPGNAVSSGEFYNVAVQYYTEQLPPLVEARDAKKLYDAIPIDQARWKLEDADGKIYDYTSRVQYAQQRFNEFLSSGSHWDVSTKIRNVTMTDATHGAVLWNMFTDWESESRQTTGRSITRGLTQWEKIDGQWRIVATKLLSSNF